ncbi:YnbE family lipoprotein [Shewanella electrodiphila]|uniref:YnbE family lipoprotein n=1 Tax=Shewanella electrodiphila TaxID=934143 RepID=A0ABT0KPV6_9GAMM|nr:YnbE family lipoprotein [Shewanella electrodiphila]
MNTLWLLCASSLLISACSPTVKIAPPDKPIEINLNVKIEHEIIIRIDKELDILLEDDELF